MMLLTTLFCAFIGTCSGGSVFHDAEQLGQPVKECRNIVCEQVHEQAKGLSKLALLDEFVSQTIFLLNDLMTNIDGELERSASSLLRYIHPECQPTRGILEEVIQKQKQRAVVESKDLGQGIGPMTEENSEESKYDFDDDQFGESDFSQRANDRDIEEDDNDDSHFGGGGGGGLYHSRESSTGGTFAWNQREHKSEEGTNGGSKFQWTGKHGNNYGTEKKGFGSEGYGSKEFGARESKHYEGGYVTNSGGGFGKSQISTDYDREIGSKNRNKKGCRGVDKGSAFWVPNLDNWCKDNCSKGYCPKTHCNC